MVLKKNKLHFLRMIGYLGLYLTLVGSATWGVYAIHHHLNNHPRFAVGALVVDGGRENTQERLVQQLTRYLGHNIFAIELHDIKEMVLTDAWVQSATVRREMPNRLRVLIHEHQPSGLALIKDRVFVVASNGMSICPFDQYGQTLDVPVLVGIPSADDTGLIRKGLEILNGIRETSLLFWGNLESLNLANPSNVIALLSHETAPFHLGDRLHPQNLLNYLSISEHIQQTYQRIQYIELGFPGQVTVMPGTVTE